MTETFRLRKSVKYQGMGYAALFLAFLIGFCSLAFFEEPAECGPKNEHSALIAIGMGAAVFGSMLLISLYLWAAYYVERLTVHGTTISIRSMFQNCQFDVAELRLLKWRVSRGGGTLFFRSLNTKARLDLHGFSENDRLRIIRILHELVPGHLQEGWPMYCHKVALRLRDGDPPVTEYEPAAKVCIITRKRYDRSLAIFLPLSLVLAIAPGISLNFWGLAILPPVVIGLWFMLRRAIPPQGRSEAHVTSTSHGRVMIVCCAGLAVSQLIMVGAAVLGFERSTACAFACLPMIAAFGFMLYAIPRLDKQRRASDERGAEAAPAKWQQGEDAASRPDSRAEQ